MNTPTQQIPAAAPPIHSARDQARLRITGRLISAIMTGHMARGMNVDDALRTAESSRMACLKSAGGLYDTNEKDFGPDHRGRRLSLATDMVAVAVAGLVARREEVGEVINKVGRSRDHMLRTSQGTIREISEGHSNAAGAKAGDAMDNARDVARLHITGRLVSAVMAGHMVRGMNVEDALLAAEDSRMVCLKAAGGLFDANEHDFGPEHSGQRLVMATDLFAAATAGLVARGEKVDEAVHKVGRSREQMLRTAQSDVRKIEEGQQPSIKAGPAPLSSVLEAYRATRSAARGPSTRGGRGPSL